MEANRRRFFVCFCHIIHKELTHENFGNASERHTDLLHLLRSDIVSAYDEDSGILFQQPLQGKVVGQRDLT